MCKRQRYLAEIPKILQFRKSALLGFYLSAESVNVSFSHSYDCVVWKVSENGAIVCTFYSQQ